VDATMMTSEPGLVGVLNVAVHVRDWYLATVL
jgi:hypothetical protein